MNQNIKSAVLKRCHQFIPIIAILVFFLFSCSTHSKISDVDAAMDNALNYLIAVQTEWGGFPTDRCFDNAMSHCVPEKTLFVPALVGLCLSENHHQKAKIIHKRLGALFTDQQGQNGTWEFYFRAPNRRILNYFPDLDDTTLIAWYLKKTGQSFNTDTMKNAVSSNKKDGIYLTFLRDYQAPMPQTWNIDPVVNAQVMMLNGVQEDDVCSFILDEISNKTIPSIYYRDRVILLYMLSRPYANGVSCIKKSVEHLYLEALALQDTNGSLGSPLRTAAFITASINSHLGEPTAVKKAVSWLLENQLKDGSWPAGFFFHGGDPNFFYGSTALTTAVVVEALEKWKAFSVQ